MFKVYLLSFILCFYDIITYLQCKINYSYDTIFILVLMVSDITLSFSAFTLLNYKIYNYVVRIRII